MDIKPDYAEEYHNFVTEYKLTEVSPEEVGAMIIRMGNYYIAYNLRFAAAIKVFSQVRQAIMSQADPLTGKAITASKADAEADATPEADVYHHMKIHVDNLNQTIQALKSLQRAVQQESGLS